MLFPSKLLKIQDAIMRICLHNRGAPPNSEPLSSKKHYAKRIKLNLRNPGEVGKANTTVMQNCDVLKLIQQDYIVYFGK